MSPDSAWGASRRRGPHRRHLSLAIAYGTPKGIGVDAEYPSVLGFTALSVAAWARSSAAAGNAVARQKRQLVVGFDSGDMIHVGEFDGVSFRRPRKKFRSVS